MRGDVVEVVENLSCHHILSIEKKRVYIKKRKITVVVKKPKRNRAGRSDKQEPGMRRFRKEKRTEIKEARVHHLRKRDSPRQPKMK